MKVLSNCSLTKLREYSQRYGAPETITVPYIKVFEKEIHLLSTTGTLQRVMKLGTKLLIDFSGKEITERQLKTRGNKAAKMAYEKRKADEIENAKQWAEIQKIAAEQQQQWIDFLAKNPQSKAKYIEKVNTLASSKWRNYLRMKAAKHINGESFQNLQVSAPQLKDALYI